eukprot:TRINITY_DN3774_c0_g1_i1.p3 TRINITY_DN3774_c0_g1~~TRINITY_DN3774_c0_g1_i1.p3  ORF type:complete len:123 (-),score=4.57 TRINITY_DN3774_c0_g1_i1:405-773(-)
MSDDDACCASVKCSSAQNICASNAPRQPDFQRRVAAVGPMWPIPSAEMLDLRMHVIVACPCTLEERAVGSSCLSLFEQCVEALVSILLVMVRYRNVTFVMVRYRTCDVECSSSAMLICIARW